MFKWIDNLNLNVFLLANENDAEYLKVPSSVKMGDELDKELSQLIALSSSDEDEQYFIEQFNNTVENCINKVLKHKKKTHPVH